jgi:hypothetical protein
MHGCPVMSASNPPRHHESSETAEVL